MSAGRAFAPTSNRRAAQVVAQPGQPLAAPVRTHMEARLGADFSGVRLHVDRAAAAAADSLDARGFTYGRHVVLGRDAAADTLAHELTHVVQQETSGVPLIQRQPRPPGAGRRAHPHISEIKVFQAGQAQHVEWTGVEGFQSGSARCSTGKGHCCAEDPAVPAATERGTRMNESSYTPVGRTDVKHKENTSRHPPWWTEFNTDRAIALHQYSPVDGSPLSHGCVRLDDATAYTIYDGAIEHVTMVEVIGTPTPLCRNANLQREWMNDFDEAEARDGETLIAFERAYGVAEAGVPGVVGKAGTPRTQASVTAQIPRCLGNLADVEERAVATAAPGSVPASPGMAGFQRRLAASSSIDEAQAVVRQFGQGLWQAARAQAHHPDLDDRPLYWARLRAATAINAWNPRDPDIRRRGIPVLLEEMERTSRGFDTFGFGTPGRGAHPPKRIVVSGFDPFGGTMGSVDQSNPSASAVLALDGTTIGQAPHTARIEGVVFPVRFADFDQGVVERVMAPFISGSDPADLVVSISRGGATPELEEWAGGRRSDDFPDNRGRSGNPAPSSGSTQPHLGPRIPGGAANEPEFRRTTVGAGTLSAMRGAVGRTGPVAGETDVSVFDPAAPGNVRDVPHPSSPPAGPAYHGSGGGYLSNEIFYRNVRLGAGTSVPIIHLHVPALAGQDPAAERATIVRQVRQILEAAVPTL